MSSLWLAYFSSPSLPPLSPLLVLKELSANYWQQTLSLCSQVAYRNYVSADSGYHTAVTMWRCLWFMLIFSIHDHTMFLPLPLLLPLPLHPPSCVYMCVEVRGQPLGIVPWSLSFYLMEAGSLVTFDCPTAFGKFSFLCPHLNLECWHYSAHHYIWLLFF